MVLVLFLLRMYSACCRYLSSGPLSGKFMVLVLFLLRLYSAVLEWLQPRQVSR